MCGVYSSVNPRLIRPDHHSRLFQKLWPLLFYKRAELDLRLTNEIVIIRRSRVIKSNKQMQWQQKMKYKKVKRGSDDRFGFVTIFYSQAWTTQHEQRKKKQTERQREKTIKEECNIQRTEMHNLNKILRQNCKKIDI